MSTKPITAKIARRISCLVADRASTFSMQSILARTGVGHADNIMSWTTKVELQALYVLAESCPQGALALEVGSYLGASTCYLGAGLSQKSGHLLCVDTWQNETMPEGERDTLKEFQNNTKNLNNLITTIRKRSSEVIASDIPAPLDLVFLDGDHSYSVTKSDFELYSQFLTTNGTIVFHDCLHFEGVSKVIGESLAGGAWKIDGNLNNLLWIKRAKWQK